LFIQLSKISYNFEEAKYFLNKFCELYWNIGFLLIKIPRLAGTALEAVYSQLFAFMDMVNPEDISVFWNSQQISNSVFLQLTCPFMARRSGMRD